MLIIVTVCTTDAIYIYKYLQSIKYRLEEAKRI